MPRRGGAADAGAKWLWHRGGTPKDPLGSPCRGGWGARPRPGFVPGGHAGKARWRAAMVRGEELARCRSEGTPRSAAATRSDPGTNAAAKRTRVTAKTMLSSVHRYTATWLTCAAWIAMMTADPAPKFAPKKVAGNSTNSPRSDHRLVARYRSCDAATAKQIVWAASSTPMTSG